MDNMKRLDNNVEFRAQKHVLECHEKRLWGHRILFGALLCLVIGMFALFAFLVSSMARVLLETPSLVLALVTCCFCLGMVPMLWGMTLLHRMAFHFFTRIDTRRMTYEQWTGLFHFRLKLSPDARVIILPSYSRGDWGYAVRLCNGGRYVSWALFNPGLVGTKQKAFAKACALQEMLAKALAPLKVGLEGWEWRQDRRLRRNRAGRAVSFLHTERAGSGGGRTWTAGMTEENKNLRAWVELKLEFGERLLWVGAPQQPILPFDWWLHVVFGFAFALLGTVWLASFAVSMWNGTSLLDMSRLVGVFATGSQGCKDIVLAALGVGWLAIGVSIMRVPFQRKVRGYAVTDRRAMVVGRFSVYSWQAAEMVWKIERANHPSGRCDVIFSPPSAEEEENGGTVQGIFRDLSPDDANAAEQALHQLTGSVPGLSP